MYYKSYWLAAIGGKSALLLAMQLEQQTALPPSKKLKTSAEAQYLDFLANQSDRSIVEWEDSTEIYLENPKGTTIYSGDPVYDLQDMLGKPGLELATYNAIIPKVTWQPIIIGDFLNLATAQESIQESNNNGDLFTDNTTSSEIQQSSDTAASLKTNKLTRKSKKIATPKSIPPRPKSKYADFNVLLDNDLSTLSDTEILEIYRRIKCHVILRKLK